VTDFALLPLLLERRDELGQHVVVVLELHRVQLEYIDALEAQRRRDCSRLDTTVSRGSGLPFGSRIRLFDEITSRSRDTPISARPSTSSVP